MAEHLLQPSFLCRFPKTRVQIIRKHDSSPQRMRQSYGYSLHNQAKPLPQAAFGIIPFHKAHARQHIGQLLLMFDAPLSMIIV